MVSYSSEIPYKQYVRVFLFLNKRLDHNTIIVIMFRHHNWMKETVQLPRCDILEDDKDQTHTFFALCVI